MNKHNIAKPKVSVVVPNYCHSRYLKQRLDSVLAQTYTDFELIILDDCSPDNGASREVIEKYRSNPHVSHIVYNEQNSGSTFKQWYKGFELAKGEYIWIAESDDYCEPTFLENLLLAVEQHKNVAIAYVTSVLIDAKNNLYPQKDISCTISEGLYKGTDFIKQHLSKYNGIWNASAVIFRKEYAQIANTQYMNYKACGDHLFWIELAEMGNVVHLSAPLNYFRIHTNKVTYNKSHEGVNHREELKIIQYLKSKNYIDLFLESSIFRIIVKQIMYNEFKTEQIRKELVYLWKSENPKLYTKAHMYWIYKKVMSYPISFLSKIRRIVKSS